MTNRSSLKIALIADDLTRVSLGHECRLMNVTPLNYRFVFGLWKPDLLFVESSWKGYKERWRYKMASYPERPSRNNNALAKVAQAARDAGIPSVFWNREDGVHFERFIDSARLFDSILTVDDTMVPAYKSRLGNDKRVDVMMFAAQPAIHFATNENPLRRASFVGSYNGNIHPARLAWQDMMFKEVAPLGIDIYDRNSDRKGANYRFPAYEWATVYPAVSYAKTAEVYRRHIANINVNTITNSNTAFSRRLVEILACGTMAVSNPTSAAQSLFGEYCTFINDAEQARDLFSRLEREGCSPQETERAHAAAEYIKSHFTWRHNLEKILAMAGK